MHTIFFTKPFLRWITALMCLYIGAASAVDVKPPETATISQSSQFVLTESEFKKLMMASDPRLLKQISHGKDALRDHILDLHSNIVLEKEAEAMEIDEIPEVAVALRKARRDILIGALMQKVNKDATISDADATALARERYALTKQKLWTPERRRAAHILLTKSSKDCKCDPEPPLAERIESLKAELAEGADFAEKARQLSKDPGSAKNGGELPDWVKQDQSLVAPFEDALFALKKPGDISEPVGSQYGYHFIKLLEIEKPRQLKFHEVRAELIKQVRQNVLVSAAEKKRASAYPDPRKINLGAAKRVLNEVLGEDAAAQAVKQGAPQSAIEEK